MLLALTITAKFVSIQPSAQHFDNTAVTVTSSRQQPIRSADSLLCCLYSLIDSTFHCVIFFMLFVLQ